MSKKSTLILFPLIMVPSPIDIFELINLSTSINYFFFNFPTITNISLFSTFGLIIISVFLISSTQKNYIKQYKLSLILSMLLTAIKNLLRDIVGGEKHIHYILFVTLTLILVTFNLMGLLPFSLSVTSHFSITFTLSFIFFVAFNLIGFMRHKTKIVLLWLPHGTPYVVTPFIILIELISYSTRIFSLAIRLFANIMSGHTLLKILSGFAWVLLISGSILSYFSIFPFVIIFLISGLEFAIALLQAYVFLTLLVIYLNDTINLH